MYCTLMLIGSDVILEYINKVYTITFVNDSNNFINQIELILSAVKNMKNGIITLSQNNNVINGKSLLDFCSLNFEKPVMLIVQGEIDMNYLNLFESWKTK